MCAFEKFTKIFEENGVKKVAIENHRLTLTEFDELQKKLPEAEFVTTNELADAIEEIRIVKTDAEIEKIKAAQKIAEDAFYRCKNLKKVVLPPNLKVIPDGCFEECENLEEVVLPQGLENIKFGAFCGCKALKSITLPQTMTVVKDHTFSACGLIEVIIPEGVTKICHGAFVQCKKLKRVVLPSTLEIIEEFAFGDCVNLAELAVQVVHLLFCEHPDAFEHCAVCY